MANYTNHTNNKPLSKEVVADIKLREANGESKVYISRSLGISYSVVRKYTTTIPWKREEALKDKVRELISQGHTRVAIAKSLGISRQWVGKVVPDKKNKPNMISEDTQKELIRRANNGEAIKQIARALGIGADSAYRIISVNVRLPGDEEIEEIKKLISANVSHHEISKQFQIPLHVIRQIDSKRSWDRRYTDDELLNIAKLFSKGIQTKEISLICECTPGLVRKAYKNALKQGLVEKRIELSLEDDRELLRIQRLYPELEEWRKYAVEWYKVVEGNFAQVCSAIHGFMEFIVKNSLFHKPSDFFLKQNAKLIPNFFEQGCSKSDHGCAKNNAVVDFLDWILLQPEFSDLTDDDLPTTLPFFRNPISKVSRRDHKALRGTESNKKVMPYWMIYDLRRRIAQGPNFEDWNWAHSLAGKITSSGDKDSRDWFEVSESQIDKNDPDCVWRIRERLDEKPKLEMWSPVRWVACLLKLQSTARMGQIRMLDSGEADTFIFEKGSFVLNQSPLAIGTVRKPRRQGVIREAEAKSLCLYFNTNKTADISKTGPDKGMECPWPNFPDHQDNPYYWIEKLRNWQSKYNPVESTIAWKDIPSSRRLRGKSELVCSTYPDAVFLFRTAESGGEFKKYPVTPSACDKVWQKIIFEYEKILEEQGKTNPDNSKIQLINNGRSEVSLHGLRVSLITHLILDGGVAPELMMKIVGHARFIMTIYYTKPGLQRIEDAIFSATAQLDATKDEALVRDLKSRSAEQIRNHVVFNSQDLIDVIPINPADRNPIGWLPMHDGICLAGGNSGPISSDTRFAGCHNGGPYVDETKRLNGPVPGGVRNCCRCRWKCAGKHHALGLQATLNNRQFHLHKSSEAAILAERKRDSLLQEKAAEESQNRLFTKLRELRSAERIHESSMQKMQELALDIAAIHRMIERVKALPENPDGPTALAAQGDMITLHAVLEETDSELLVLAAVCEDVELFPDLEPGTAIFEFAQLIDQAFEREGQPLILARMSEQEKLIASNAIMRELERYANPENPYFARRKIVQIMDRGESLERTLGINLRNVIQNANKSISKQASLRLVSTELNGTRGNYDE